MKKFNMHHFANNPVVLFHALAAVMIVAVIGYFPLQPLKSFERKDNNASNCPYYFSLESLLASYPLLSADKANAAYIQHKLVKFEGKMANPKLPAATIQQYKVPYQQALQTFGLTTVNTALSAAQIIAITEKVMPIVDGFYLNKSINCQNTYYTWANQSHRIIRYNTNGLYDQKPNKYSRILMATNEDWLTGSTAAHFVLNQTETLDTRFMAGLPLLSALYVIPKSDYSQSGNYASPGNWRYFNPTLLQDPIIRKVEDIGGADIFTFFKKDLGHQTLAQTRLLPTQLYPQFSELFTSVINERSYGIAYFANQVTYADKQVIQGYENTIKHYFIRRDDPAVFTATTKLLYDKLMQLKNKYDVIVESTPLQALNTNVNPGNITINGIVGERASFSSHCQRTNCLFVFNMGDVPGWHAYINGVERPILRTNFAFMGTEVPRGDSAVWFIYASAAQMISFFVSIAALLGVVLLTLLPTKTKARPLSA